MTTTRPRTIFSWTTLVAWIAAAIAAAIWRGELVAVVEHASETSIFVRVFTYATVYVTLAGLNVPGAVLLTVLAGPLFGTALGTIVASFVSTLGALLAFLLNRHFLSSHPRQENGLLENSSKTSAGFSSSKWNPATLGARQLLLMRLVPVIPFFAVNLLAGRSRVSAVTFWLVSQLGMLPATLLLVHGGASLSRP